MGAVYGCSWGWTHYKYLSPHPRPDRWLPGPRQGLVTALCVRPPGAEGAAAHVLHTSREREERVMLFVTAIPWGADGGGEMFNVVRHLLFTEKLWLLDLLTHSCYTHTDLSC